jgi:hypothetical protein
VDKSWVFEAQYSCATRRRIPAPGGRCKQNGFAHDTIAVHSGDVRLLLGFGAANVVTDDIPPSVPRVSTEVQGAMVLNHSQLLS